MTAFMARTDAYQDASGYARVGIFAGKDADHLAFAGMARLKPDEVVEFCTLINGPAAVTQEQNLDAEREIEVEETTDRQEQLTELGRVLGARPVLLDLAAAEREAMQGASRVQRACHKATAEAYELAVKIINGREPVRE